MRKSYFIIFLTCFLCCFTSFAQSLADKYLDNYQEAFIDAEKALNNKDFELAYRLARIGNGLSGTRQGDRTIKIALLHIQCDSLVNNANEKMLNNQHESALNDYFSAYRKIFPNESIFSKIESCALSIISNKVSISNNENFGNRLYNDVYKTSGKSVENSIGILQIAALYGNGNAAEDAGCYFLEKGKYQRAIDLFEIAKKYQLDVWNNLGYCYEGLSKGASYSQKSTCLSNAFNCYLEAAKNGSRVGQYNVGACYRDGKGVSRNLSEAKSWLQKSYDNGYEKAKVLLDRINTEIEKSQLTKVNPPKKNFFEELFWDDPFAGLSLVSDFGKYPLGIKGDFLWGGIHVGVDLSIGSFIFSDNLTFVHEQFSIPSINGQTVEPTIEFLGSEGEKTFGTFAYTITPGIFYKYVSLDCGLGQIFTQTSRIDNYKYTYDASTVSGNESVEVSSSLTTVGTRQEKVIVKNSYFVYKPGLTAVIGNTDEYAFIMSARYRICPKDKALNGFELSLGMTIPF